MSKSRNSNGNPKVFSKQADPIVTLQLILIAVTEIGLAGTLIAEGARIQATVLGGISPSAAVQLNTTVQATLQTVITTQLGLLAQLEAITSSGG